MHTNIYIFGSAFVALVIHSLWIQFSIWRTINKHRYTAWKNGGKIFLPLFRESSNQLHPGFVLYWNSSFLLGLTLVMISALMTYFVYSGTDLVKISAEEGWPIVVGGQYKVAPFLSGMILFVLPASCILGVRTAFLCAKALLMIPVARFPKVSRSAV